MSSLLSFKHKFSKQTTFNCSNFGRGGGGIITKIIKKYWNKFNKKYNKRIKVYDTIEAAGSLLIFNECNEPISDVWIIINICITIYLLFIIIFSFIYNSTSINVGHKFWFGIYNQLILYLNAFNCIIQCYITYIIWNKYKYPQKHGYFMDNNQFDEEESELELELEINLHSDSDDLINNNNNNDINDDIINNNINLMKLDNISFGLGFLYKLSKMILYISLSGSLLNGLLFWSLINYNLANDENDTDWIYIILHIQYYLFVVLALIFKFYSSFINLNYLYPILYIIIYDSLFAIFIIFYEIFHNNNITLFAKPTVSDDFNFNLLLLIFIFMIFHVIIHLFLTFTKNIVTMNYLKYILLHTNIKIAQIMDPLDFDLINNGNAEDDDYTTDNKLCDGKTKILNNNEGSDIEFSSYDFNNKDKLDNNTENETETDDNKEMKNDNDHNKDSSIKIVFGSNIHQRYNRMPVVRSLTKNNPDIVIFLGNNIYFDETPRKFGVFRDVIDDNDEFDYKLNKLFNFWKIDKLNLDLSTEYQRLLKHADFILCNKNNTLPIVLATWDQHDFNPQNRYHSKSSFLSFLDCIDMRHELSEYIDNMKQNTNRGIYYHYDYHHVNNQNNNNNKNDDKDKQHIFIRFIMLDLKFSKTSEQTFGSEQWLWIRKLLKNSKQRKDKPDWHIFVFGTPCFVEKFNLNENMKEKYENDNNDTKQYKLPNLISPIPINGKDFHEWTELSKNKLLGLIKEIGINDKTIFLSGNMCYSQVLYNQQHDIHEIICSSLTHSIPSLIPNDYYIKNNYKSSEQKTNICNVNGYGLLEVTKDEWNFAVKDENGNCHIPLSSSWDPNDI